MKQLIPIKDEKEYIEILDLFGQLQERVLDGHVLRRDTNIPELRLRLDDYERRQREI